MRRFIHVLTGLILLVILLGAGVSLIHMASYPDCWVACLEHWPEQRGWGMLAGVALIVVVVIYALSGCRGRAADEPYLSFSNNGTTVSILLRAVNEFIGKIGDEFAAIVAMKPMVYPRGRSIDVHLELRVKTGTQLPELSQLLQERVRDSLQQNMGLTNIKHIYVQVKELVGDAPTAGEDLLDDGA